MALPSQPVRPKVKRKNKRKKTALGQKLSELQRKEGDVSASFVNGQNPQIHVHPSNLEEHQPYKQNQDTNLTDDEDFHQNLTFRERTLREEENWSTETLLMFPVYMKCSKLTLQWGDPNRWNHDFRPTCDCPDYKRRERIIDVVDILSKSFINPTL